MRGMVLGKIVSRVLQLNKFVYETNLLATSSTLSAVRYIVSELYRTELRVAFHATL